MDGPTVHTETSDPTLGPQMSVLAMARAVQTRSPECTQESFQEHLQELNAQLAEVEWLEMQDAQGIRPCGRRGKLR